MWKWKVSNTKKFIKTEETRASVARALAQRKEERDKEMEMAVTAIARAEKGLDHRNSSSVKESTTQIAFSVKPLAPTSREGMVAYERTAYLKND